MRFPNSSVAKSRTFRAQGICTSAARVGLSWPRAGAAWGRIRATKGGAPHHNETCPHALRATPIDAPSLVQRRGTTLVIFSARERWISRGKNAKNKSQNARVSSQSIKR
jgi:hypothetical protein